MPVHDWSRLEAGLFRDFHNSWYVRIYDAMNDGLLPTDYYALIEQNAGDILTDVLTLRAPTSNGHTSNGHGSGPPPIAVATMPPKIGKKLTLPRDYQVPADKQLAIRHVSGDRVVAIIEIVSRGNKSTTDELQRFVVKAAEAIRLGIHPPVVDLQPPTGRDP